MIWITQCLCESRHCIMAGAWDDTQSTRAEGVDSVRATFTAMNVSFCRACQSRKFHYESNRTKFKTMEEAAGRLAACEALRRGTGDLMEQMNAATKH